MPAKCRLKLDGELAKCHCQVCARRSLHNEIAASHDKSAVHTQRPAGIDIPSPRQRKHGSQLRYRQRAQKGIHAANDPDAKDESRLAQVGSDIAGRAQDARGNGLAHNDSNPKAHAEDAKQVPFRASARVCNCRDGPGHDSSRRT